MFSGGESEGWVLLWKDHREVFPNFDAAKADMLDMLWWWARDYVTAEPKRADEIMDAWVHVSKLWRKYSFHHVFKITVLGDDFYIVQLGHEDEVR